ncbi:acetate/propionate family kinase [Aureimonas populi]|uniref:Acetate kinase n=1 Tax=Aureimonas populi TaxID=1701758 RepID=A0ABW5CPS5_9HYPH|nr:acetate/propionate family kinase [Aureimonas populi]
MSDSILVLNAGSSSLKFAVYERDLRPALKGAISGLGHAPRLAVRPSSWSPREEALRAGPMEMREAVSTVFDALAGEGLLAGVCAVGHRIVHGGARHVAPVRLDEEILAYLRTLNAMAPLHQPFNLQIVDACRALMPQAAQIGCFDTAFHASRPAIETLYGLPRALLDEGLVSYGFHGLSYGFIAHVLRERFGPSAGGRVVVAHLGSGSSLCAMREGRSVSTTMGFSPLDGPIMSTRCGAIDPGILLHLMTARGMSGEDMQALLYKQSGLLGVSGLSGDMQVLLASGAPHAREALDLFVLSVSRQIGQLAASLGGLDALVFTAGIGENSPAIRARICEAAAWLGAAMDDARNDAGVEDIAAPHSRLRLLVIPTDEEKAVAEGVLAAL